MPQEKLKVVFDCNVYLQAFLSANGIAAKCKKLVGEGLIELFISRDIFDEVSNVLARPEFQAKFSHITPEAMADFIEEVNDMAIFVRKVEKHFELTRDRKDEPYINLAVEIDANFIITWDRDLLDLMTGTDIESKSFRQRFRPLKVVEPIEFLKIIEEKDLSLKS
ncbi:MAG: putative toxin-antitoxin system toxin component, PIN family [Aridibacter sp.]